MDWGVRPQAGVPGAKGRGHPVWVSRNRKGFEAVGSKALMVHAKGARRTAGLVDFFSQW